MKINLKLLLTVFLLYGLQEVSTSIFTKFINTAKNIFTHKIQVGHPFVAQSNVKLVILKLITEISENENNIRNAMRKNGPNNFIQDFIRNFNSKINNIEKLNDISKINFMRDKLNKFFQKNSQIKDDGIFTQRIIDIEDDLIYINSHSDFFFDYITDNYKENKSSLKIWITDIIQIFPEKLTNIYNFYILNRQFLLEVSITYNFNSVKNFN